MMQEPNETTLSWWVVITDHGEHRLSEKEMQNFLQADHAGIRFIMFDNFVLNTAFVKEAYRKIEKRDLRFDTITGEEKYILENKSDPKRISNPCAPVGSVGPTMNID